MSLQTQVSLTQTFNASAENVWNIIREFHALPKYVAAIKDCTLRACELNGTVRTMTLADGSLAEEKLDLLDEEKKVLAYSLVKSEFPIADYSATMELKPVDDKTCELHWNGKLTPKGVSKAEVESLMMGFYLMGIEGLNNLIAVI